ncbi:MAG TPA: hypothetical protein PKO18_00200 [Chitinophagales bacterium]|nr:hypothetical protein [Chitinophagales bacterium]
MKTPITNLVLIIMVVVSAVSCKKGNEINLSNKPVKQIQSENDLYSYSYNTDGKVIEVNVKKLDDTTPSPATTMSTQLMYNADEITIRQSNSTNNLLSLNQLVRRADTLRTPDGKVRLQMATEYQTNATITHVNHYQYIDVLSGLFTEVTDSLIYRSGNLFERITYQRLPGQNNFTNIAYYTFEAGNLLNHLNYLSSSDAEIPFMPESILLGGFNLHTSHILGTASRNAISHIKKYSKRNGILLEEISNIFTTNNEGLILTKQETKKQNSTITTKSIQFAY